MTCKPYVNFFSLLVCIILIGPATAQNDERACSQTRVNVKGSSGASITVDATVGGITVADANTSRCSLIIKSESVNPMRCGPSTGKYAIVVSSTVGFLWPLTAEVTPILGWAAQEAWKCIRTGGTSNTVSVMETLP